MSWIDNEVKAGAETLAEGHHGNAAAPRMVPAPPLRKSKGLYIQPRHAELYDAVVKAAKLQGKSGAEVAEEMIEDIALKYGL